MNPMHASRDDATHTFTAAQTSAATTHDPLQVENEQLRKRLAESQRMAALGELMSTTTHEFNNILTTVINYAKMGLRATDDQAKANAFDKILTAGRRAAKITNSVLGMARNRSSDPEPSDVRTIVDETLLLLERELRKYRVQMETRFQDIPEALICGNQIQQVLINLIVNARQAMPDGGTVIVSLSHDEPGDMIDLMVRDTGSGIPQDKLPHIFDSYYSTKSGPDESGKGGTGLGLATCKEIMEAHGGRIRVQTAVGKGTAFTLRLPVATKRPS